MKDGFTPVTRIFDVSHNAMSGVFPGWLVANIPLLVSSCQCSVAVGIDAASFSCPTALPRLSREAQSVLRRFEALRCTAPGGMMTSAQQVPVWQVAAGGSTGRHGMMSRAEHKAAMAQHQGAGAGGVQRHQQHQRTHVVLAAVAGVLGSVALLAGAAAAAIKLKAHSRWSSQPHSRQAPPGEGHYSRLPDFSTYHPPSSYSDAQSQSPHGSDGSDSPYALDGSPRSSGSPSASSSTSSSSSGGGRSGGSRTARSSSTDGSVEIALVSRPSSAEK